MTHASQQKNVSTVDLSQAFQGRQARNREQVIEVHHQAGGIVHPTLCDAVRLPMGVQKVWTLPTALGRGHERARSSRLVWGEPNGVEIRRRGNDWECSVHSVQGVSSPSGAGFGTRSETEVRIG